ncbi:unnamed protein product [Darwinula stevensoni]|uniref:Anion exchange protein n=1 Tax=Darwinula stevensoni TaxID=69355 RepID=A0A7R9A475_9CRUS|nr:unnamed protein product [Darwinula stevensoni]CAG0893072.1 unnamed protein product [Darwinula stevensoni]
MERHRAHTVYVGVHVPGNGGHRSRRSHRRHRHHHKHSSDSQKEKEDERPGTPPSQRVQFILGEDEDDMHESHPLFSEMEELIQEGGEMEWRETARWVKFEEDVEEGGNRWSKPHVATLSLHSLFELRSFIMSGIVLLDMEAQTMEQVADLTIENWINTNVLQFDLNEKVKDALLRRHRHQHERRKDNSSSNVSRLPIIRSLAEIGRSYSSSKSLKTAMSAAFKLGKKVPSVPRSTTWSGGARSMDEMSLTVADQGQGQSQSQSQSLTPVSLSGGSGGNSLGDIMEDEKEERKPKKWNWYKVKPMLNGPYSAVPQQEGDELSKTSASIQDSHILDHSATHASLQATSLGESEAGVRPSHSNLNFMRKIPPGAEASNILVGEVDFLDRPITAFIRLNAATHLGNLTEVPLPTRFLFIILGPAGNLGRFHEIGRAIATLMSDEVFHEIAYKAKHRSHLLAGVDEFLDAVTVLPPGEWDPSIRIEPPGKIPSQVLFHLFLEAGHGSRDGDEEPRKHPEQPKEEVHEEEEEQKIREENGLVRSGRLFGGLRNDLKRKLPWYFSDFRDSLSIQCIASWIFLYFACLSPIITFGGLMGDATENRMAAMESLVSGFVNGVCYALFSGQPLTILGSTGPVLVFETILYDFCKSNALEYLSFRLWIGVWVAIFLFIMVAVDLSYIVCLITRFTEENFACLIAFIFIYKAVEKVMMIGIDYPINMNPNMPLDYSCWCEPSNISMVDTETVNWTSLSKKDCVKVYNGTLAGSGCDTPQYYPDVFLMSLLLFLGTFAISVFLKNSRTSPYFPTNVRVVVSDFAVILAIFSMTITDFLVGINTPKLIVPQEFKPTWKGRGWIIPPFGNNPWWTAIAAPIPAALATILIFMDQQITAVIVNRKEHKLKKGCGYHLDLFVLTCLILICSLMGIPWFVAATVLSINHVNSLKLESECAAPGEKPQFLGVREQRVTHLLIFVMMGLSVALTPVLKHIPMPVLYGVFLYMGVSSLKGLQFFDRILIMFMPAKYQPDLTFLRQVPLKRVHLFTIVQLLCFILLWVIKSFKDTSILFPFMLVVMIGIRKLLDFVFEPRELKVLDDILPEITRRKKEEERQKRESLASQGSNDEDENHDCRSAGIGNLRMGPSGSLTLPLPNGNVIKIPADAINISEEMNKSGVWKQVSSSDLLSNKDKEKDKECEKSSKSRTAFEMGNIDEKKRLSHVPEEEEEDVGITITVDPPSKRNSPGAGEPGETPV